MQNSAVRKARGFITLSLSIFLFFNTGAQIPLNRIRVVYGDYDYTPQCRIRVTYNGSKKSDTLSYTEFTSFTYTPGTISCIQILPAMDDMDDYCIFEPMDFKTFSSLKPVFPIPLKTKTDAPPMAYDRIINPDSLTYYIRTPEIDQYIGLVCDQINNPNLAAKLYVIGASVPTFAESRVFINKDLFCYLYYNPDTLLKLINQGDSLVICGILLHEMGHIFNLENLKMDTSNIQEELAADNYAGRCLYEMNADTSTIDKMVSFIRNTQRTGTYPSKQERRQSLMQGWRTEHDQWQERIIADSLSEYRVLDSIQIILDENHQYKDAIKFLKSINLNFRFRGNRLLAERMLGECYYNLAGSNKDYYLDAIAHFDVFLTGKKEIDIYYKTGYASFQSGLYNKAKYNFIQILNLKPDPVMTRDVYYYKGICLQRMDSLSDALQAFDYAILQDPFKPALFINRAELKVRMFPDTLSLAIEDYLVALKLTSAHGERDTLKKAINKLTRELFRAATGRGTQSALRTYGELKWLQRCRLDSIPPDFNYQMALCFKNFWLIKDTVRQNNDSVIYYCSKYLDLKPVDSAKALLMRGKAWLRKSQREKDGLLCQVKATTDFKHIPIRSQEYDESAFYLTRISIRKKEYCEILGYYSNVTSSVYREKIKNEICVVLKDVKGADCYKHADRKRLKDLCKEN